jgi:eukaryotic-like serine/threonine-protein kinase
MPDLSNRFHDDVVKYMAQLGFTAPPTVGPAVDAGAAGHFKVVQQDPLPNTPVNRDATVTVNYGS